MSLTAKGALNIFLCYHAYMTVEQSAAESRGGYSSSNSGNGGHSNSSAVAVPAGPHLGDRLMEGRIQQVNSTLHTAFHKQISMKYACIGMHVCVWACVLVSPYTDILEHTVLHF
jgi:hypothetical protein